MTDEAAELQLLRVIKDAKDRGDEASELKALKAYKGIKAMRELPPNMQSKVSPYAYQIGDPLSNINADISTGAPAAVRAGASIKMTPEGKMSYLESHYGKGNVAIRRDGELFVKPKDSEKWVKLDEGRMSFRDIGDMAGGAIEAAPAMAASFATANPLAAGGGAAIGNVARQAVSSMLPGDDQMTFGDRAKSAGISAALGTVSQYGANKLAGLTDKVRPHNLVASKVQKDLDTPFARRGEFLSKETGIELSPAQQSGSKGHLMLEGVARQHPMAADKVLRFDIAQSKQAVKKLNTIMDTIDRTGKGAIQTGQMISKTFDDAVNKTLNVRRSQAKVDFGLVEELAAGQKVIPTSAMRAQIQTLIDDFNVPGGGDATASLVSKLKGVLADIGEDGLTGKEAERLLEVYGNAAKGTGQILNDIDKSQQRMIAGRVVSGIMKDLDDAIENGVAGVRGGYGAQTAQALKTARNNYRLNSQELGKLEESVLGRLFNGKYDPAPEAIADKFMKMHPSEIKAAANILNGQNPETMQAVKRHMLQSAMDNSLPSASATNAVGASGIGEAGVMFSPRKFNSYMQNNADRFRAAFSPKEIVEVKRVYEQLQRISDRAGMEGSQTGPFLIALDVMKGMFTTNPVNTVKAGVVMLAPKKIASAMTTPEGRKAMLTLVHAKKGTKATVASAAYLTALWNREESMMQNAAQQGGPQNRQ